MIGRLKNNINTPISTNVVCYTMVEAAQISTPRLDSTRSLFSQPRTIEQKERYYLDDHNNCIPIWSLSANRYLDSIAYNLFHLKEKRLNKE